MTKTDKKSPVKTQQHFGTSTRRRLRKTYSQSKKFSTTACPEKQNP